MKGEQSYSQRQSYMYLYINLFIWKKIANSVTNLLALDIKSYKVLVNVIT